MEFNSIYKNGRPDYFFITIESEERPFVQPYFIVTDIDHKKRGNITYMEVLQSFGNFTTYYGKGRHGYGYSFSADIYGELIDIIETLYKDALTEAELEELRKSNTHDEKVVLAEGLLAHLKELNEKALEEKWKKMGL